MIAANGLTFAYGSTVVLHDVSIEVRPGELLALIGPNGAGKSTLLRGLAGLCRPRAGSVALDGVAVESLPPQTRARHVALIEVDGGALDDLAVREAVALGRLPYRPWWRWSALPGDDAIVEGALERAGLTAFADRAVATLSSGEAQLIWIALALAQQARTVLFDEPTSHLDVHHAVQMLALLRGLADDGAAVAVVLHDLNLAAAYGDRVAVLAENTLLACDVPAAVFTEALLTRAYRVPIVVRRDGAELFAFAKRGDRRHAKPPGFPDVRR